VGYTENIQDYFLLRPFQSVPVSYWQTYPSTLYNIHDIGI